MKQINEIVACFQFHHLCPKHIQLVQEYIKEIKQYVAICKHDNFAYSMIRNKIVFGVLNKNARRSFLSKHDLTLDKAVEVAIGTAHSEEDANYLIKKREQLHTLRLYAQRTTSKDDGIRDFRAGRIEVCRKCLTSHRYGNCPVYNAI